MGDELTNAALIGLIGMVGIALILRAAGSVTAFRQAHQPRDVGVARRYGVAVEMQHMGHQRTEALAVCAVDHRLHCSAEAMDRVVALH